jgi:hypothetical protein
MAIIGKKFIKKTRKLGKKFDDKVHKLGQKSNNVLDKIEGANNKVINKSGKALDITKKVLGTADKIVGVLNDAGVRDVPVLGTATGALETGLHQGHKGVSKLDTLRDKYAKTSKKALNKGHKYGNQLEKHNTRKMLAKMVQEENGDSFV